MFRYKDRTAKTEKTSECRLDMRNTEKQKNYFTTMGTIIKVDTPHPKKKKLNENTVQTS